MHTMWRQLKIFSGEGGRRGEREVGGGEGGREGEGVRKRRWGAKGGKG